MTRYLVWDPENSDEDDAISVDAYDHESAAVVAMERIDLNSGCEYTGQLMREGVELFVKGPSGKVLKFHCTAEPDINYYATEKEGEEA